MMYFAKVLKSPSPPVFEFHFLKVSRLDVAKQKNYTFPSSLVNGPEIWLVEMDVSSIKAILFLAWGVEAAKMTNRKPGKKTRVA